MIDVEIVHDETTYRDYRAILIYIAFNPEYTKTSLTLIAFQKDTHQMWNNFRSLQMGLTRYFFSHS